MDRATFQAAFEARPPEATFARLAARFHRAFERTHDIHSAMAAVNEISPVPLAFAALFEEHLEARA